MPEISVIMPVYNAEQYLRAAIDSVLRQTFTDFELICVDDGSKDNSGNICDEYALIDPRVVVRHQQNSGICAARNRGISMARGKYIAFIDNDDLYEPGLLENAHRLVVLHEAQVVKFGYRVKETFADGSMEVRERHSLALEIYARRQLYEGYPKAEDSGFFYAIWNGLYQKKLFDRLQFNENIRFGCEDWDLNYRLYAELNKVVLVPDIYYIYYQRAGTSTSKKFDIGRVTGCAIAAKSQWEMFQKLDFFERDPGLCYEWLGKNLIEIIYLFKLQGCHYTFSQKRTFLRELSACAPFRDEDIDPAVRIISRNKRLVVGLFYKKRYGLLLLIAGIYWKARGLKR